MDNPLQPTCWAGMQAMGTLLGTMFGLVSAALLTPIHGGEREEGIPAVPGVIIGSSLGVLAAHSAGEGNQPVRHLAYLLAFGVVGAAGTTSACSWLLGDMLRNGGSAGIMALATIASFGSTAVFTLHNHNMLLRRAAAATGRGDTGGGGGAAFDHHLHRDGLPRIHDECALPDPKEV
ncbi:unnamed protein product [Hapterophycus canaliculatus]